MKDMKDCIVSEEVLVKSDEKIPRAGEGSSVLLKDGSIMLGYSQFTGLSDHDFAVIVSRISNDGGRSWSDPKTILEKSPDALNVMSISFLRLQDGRIGFLYIHKYSTTDCIPYICFSSDEGKSWSDPVQIAERGTYYVVNNDRLYQTSEGRLLVPFAIHASTGYIKWDEIGDCGTFYSDDNGLSWKQSKNVVRIKKENAVRPHKIEKGKEGEWEKILEGGICSQEPGVIELSDGRIMMWVRTSGGYMYKAISRDGGETWDDFKPVLSIVSPTSPQAVKRIPGTSRLVCVYNDHRDYSYLQENWWHWRTPLSIAVSDDEGENWKTLGNIEDASHNYCYTSMLFFEDKMLLTYYLSNNYNKDGKPVRYNLASLKVKTVSTKELV